MAKLADELLQATGDVIVRVVDPTGNTYELHYLNPDHIALYPIPNEIAMDRADTIEYLTLSAFGTMNCSTISNNGKTHLEVQAIHISWTPRSGPFHFKRC